MKSKIMSNQISEKKKHSRLKKRRAVAEIISTMLLMGLTVGGATTLTYFVNDGFISGNLSAASSLESSSRNVALLAYDTRDSSSLLKLADVDNEILINSFLCGVTCSVPINSIPENGGTEFIVMQIRNNGIDTIFLEDIAINNVVHSWDSTTSGVQLDASTNSGATGKYPIDGMFSIMPVGSTPIIQNENYQIQSGQTVNLLIKLGPNDSDILLNAGIRILLDTGGIHPIEFMLISGDAR
jgi:hypothetical protein